MAKQEKKKVYLSSKFYLASFVILALIGLGGAVKANLGLGELLVSKLADKIPVELILERLGLSELSDKFGLTTINSANTGLTNLRIAGVLQMGSSSSTNKYYVTQYDVEDWPATTSSLRFANNRSTTSTVSRVVFDGTGTATQVVSSTFIISCGNVNANPAYAYNSAQGTRPGGLIEAARFTTGTQPYFDSLSTSTVSVLVGPGESLDCLAQANGVATTVECANNGIGCEAVTSTNRGWDANVIVEWSYVDE